jgi:hypothetical protein
VLWTEGKSYGRGDVVYATITNKPSILMRLWCWVTRSPLPTKTTTVMYRCVEDMKERDMPKRKKPDAAERAGNRIREWWVDKGCVEHSDRLRDYAAKAIRRAISAAVRSDRKARRGKR